MKKPLIIAHRGASAYAPENTMSAYRKAIEMNAGGIELDIHLTRDGYPVVIHDSNVDRTSNGKGAVSSMTLAELKKLDFGSWFSPAYKNERIPALPEVFELISSWKGLLNIEIKDGPEINRVVVDLLRKYPSIRNVIISSFNHQLLYDLKEISPDLRTGLLCSSGEAVSVEYCIKMKANAIHPHFSDMDCGTVKKYRAKGIIVNVYTVNHTDDIKKMALSGVDGIITNVPDTALSTINTL